jgi:hypothetical protein
MREMCEAIEVALEMPKRNDNVTTSLMSQLPLLKLGRTRSSGK